MVQTRAEWERQRLRALKKRLRQPLRNFAPVSERVERERARLEREGRDLPVYAREADNDDH